MFGSALGLALAAATLPLCPTAQPGEPGTQQQARPRFGNCGDLDLGVGGRFVRPLEDGDVGAAIDRARRLIAATAPSAAVARVLVLDEAIHASVALPRFRSFLVAGLASLAGLLALLGVYGVLSYSVAQQRHEIGVRKALGAGAVRVMTAIIGPGLRLVLAGLAIGLLVAWALADVIEAFVFEIAPDDPRIYLTVALAVLLVGLLAALVPARRAASVSPIEILDR